MRTRSSWFTQVRVRRLAAILDCLPVRGHRSEERTLAVWRACGGPVDETGELLRTLFGIALVEVRSEELRRTKAGQAVYRTSTRGDLRDLGLSIIRSGAFHDQARRLIESGRFDATGALRCPLKSARLQAPQLVGLLSYWPEVHTKGELVIPRPILDELESVWALLPPVEIPEWAKARKEVGSRAEMYTVQFERTRVAPYLIAWVARDDDSLGYDVEDRSTTPVRCIEVKGRRDDSVVFFLTDNEWEKAGRLGESYEVHFWGRIDLNRDPAVEYKALRELGYPCVYRNFSRTATDLFDMQAVKWRFELKPI